MNQVSHSDVRRARGRAATGLVVALAAVGLSCTSDALDPDRPEVASVVVSPDRVTVGVGGTAPLAVEVRDASGALLRDRKVVFASKDPSVATVSGAGVITGVSPGNVQVAATTEGKSAIAEVTVNPKAVASVRLTPAGDVRLLVGQNLQLAAEPLDADGAVLSGRTVTWSSNSTGVATVSATGLITAVAPGGAVITAASEGRSAVAAVTVSNVPVASVAVTPGTDTVVVSQTLQLTATPRDAEGNALAGRSVTWSTSDAARATVSSTGLVTGVAPGDVTITATSDGVPGTARITVRPKPVAAVIVSPAQLSVTAGQTRQLTVQVTDEQGNVLTGRPVTFSTDKPAVATVSAAGVVTAVSVGTAKITATSEGKSGAADVTVTAVPVASVDVTPPQADLIVGQSVALTATARDAAGSPLPGRPAAWTSGAPSVATVSASGVVTAVGVGSAIIFATIEGRTGSATINVRQVPVGSVTVTPTTAAIAVGGSVQLSATVRDASGTVLTNRVVGWSSSNETIAIVSSTGRVTGLKAGVVTITAASEGVTGSASVSVGISSVTVSPTSATIVVLGTRQFTATPRDASGNPISGLTATWSSSAPLVASVTQQGLVTGLLPGSATISAAYGSVAGTASVTVQLAPVATVTVTPSSASIKVNQTVQLTATLRDASGNVLTGRTVTWSSNDTADATVDQNGLVTGRSTGSATIRATSEGKSGTSTVTVTN